MNPAQKHPDAFTLVEVLVSMIIVSILVVILASMVNSVNTIWVTGEQRTENSQNGRAILEIIARELAPALISNRLQFVQNPGTAGAADLNALFTGTVKQRANSDSLFWQIPSSGNSYGNVYEVGYMLTQDVSVATAPKYQLQRFSVLPDTVTPATSATHYYRIFDAASSYTSPKYTSTSPWLPVDAAPWLVQLTASSGTPAATQFQKCLAPVSEGVLGFWIRCLDQNGTPIPWLSSATGYTTSPNPLKFNSAAGFNPAVFGGTSFQYTSATSTLAANRLPSSVELSIITLDSRTLKRTGSSIPAIPAATSATDVPNEMTTYMNTLVSQKITSARQFTTTVHLSNGTD